jgi:hypothetical protein
MVFNVDRILLRFRTVRGLVATNLFLMAVLASGAAQAQTASAARQAFDQARAAQLQNDFAQAADLFELADRLAQSPEALRSAIRMHIAAGNRARAANLGEQAQARYPDDAATTAVANEAMSAASGLGRVRIRCATPCTVELDGRAVSQDRPLHSIYVEPGERRIRVTDADASEEMSVSVSAGETVEREADPQPAAVEDPVIEAEPEVGEPEARPPRAVEQSSGLPVWVPLAVVGAAAVAGGILVWSGLDTLSARDDYVANPTEQGYNDGVGLETRTNILIGVTAGLGAAAAVLAIFTDWDGSEVEVAAGPGVVAVRGTF